MRSPRSNVERRGITAAAGTAAATDWLQEDHARALALRRPPVRQNRILVVNMRKRTDTRGNHLRAAGDLAPEYTGTAWRTT